MAVAKEVRKRQAKRALIIVAIVIFSLGTITGLFALVNTVGNAANLAKAESFDRVEILEQLIPEEDENGHWTFTTDGDFKIMQLTDIHLGGGFMSFRKDSWAINAIAAMITYEKPDLVIVTGDVVYPVPFQAGSFNNLASMRIFVALMEQLGVYWTLTFGNHDTEIYSFYNRTQVAAFFEDGNFEYCLFKRGPSDVDGEGNQIINVKNTLGLITQSLVLLDSHSYVDRDYFGIRWRYDNIHDNQIEWYRENITQFSDYNTTVLDALDAEDVPENPEIFIDVKSLMFFHIPLVEFKDAWYEYMDNDYEDTENVRFIYGDALEGGKIVYSGVGEDNLFETILEIGSTKGIFCGHDHLNNFSLEYHGVRLTYGKSIDYLAYMGIHRKGAQRGCTIIIVDNEGNFESYNENYYQQKYVPKYEKENVSME